jgi:hypothetical protein
MLGNGDFLEWVSPRISAMIGEATQQPAGQEAREAMAQQEATARGGAVRWEAMAGEAT